MLMFYLLLVFKNKDILNFKTMYPKQMKYRFNSNKPPAKQFAMIGSILVFNLHDIVINYDNSVHYILNLLSEDLYFAALR